MKQFTAPVVISNGRMTALEKVSLNSKSYSEDWIQDICFRSPNLLPVEELEPAFAGMIPICRELSTESGSIDLVYVNESGFITIGECKLWRNPEARRKVVGQILDYAKDMAKWDYSKFEKECLKARKERGKSLFQIVEELYPEAEEATFIDNLQINLNKGRFLLTIIGDGIRTNMEELTNFIHRNGNLNFTLGLIELPIYRNPDNDELIVTPRVLAKTKEIERVVYRFADKSIEEETEIEEVNSRTISETVFFERLQNSVGKAVTDTFKLFIGELSSELHIISKLGRGKKLSINLKSMNDSYNFASIREDGEVWFYGIVSKTEEIGSRQIGIDYLKKLAVIVNGEYYDKYKQWFWCVKKSGKYIQLKNYMKYSSEWKSLISQTMDEIRKLEEEE
ncbi:MAG: hypothetical protein K8S62_07920 [Candidatus Sabulitectum sp.]|nr:hypothetical protein [Candidatus Sabulitectum sp.]